MHAWPNLTQNRKPNRVAELSKSLTSTLALPSLVTA